MPNKRCFPECSGKYAGKKKVQVFSFLKDENTRQKCIQAIPRKDSVPTAYMKV